MGLIDDLKKHFSGEFSVDEKILDEHSRDASIFEVRPKVVVFPKNTKHVEQLVQFLKKFKGKYSVAARSGGTCMSGGGLTESISISFSKYMNQIHSLNTKKAVVSPGLFYRDLEKKMDRLKVFYPSYPASKSICALGGMIANNSGSEKTLTYGQTVDHVRKLHVVLADGKSHVLQPLNVKQLKAKMRQKDFEGQLYRKIYNICEKNYDLIKKAQPKTHKNSSGYFLWRVWDRKTFDLTKLFVGSQGTLGLWTKAEVNVIEKKKHRGLVVVYLNKLKRLTEVVNAVLPYNPESLEAFDKATMKLGLRFFPEIAKQVGVSLFSFLWGFRREALLTLRYGFPKFIIMVELTGDKKSEVEEKRKKLSSALKEMKMPHLQMRTHDEAEKYWVVRRKSFGLLRDKVKDKRATPFIDDFAVEPKHLPEFLPKLYKMLRSHKIKPTLAGHAGDGNFHIIPLMDLTKKKERDKIPIVLDKFLKLVLEYKGTITAEHNDGLIRTPYIKKQYGAKMNSLFEQVKDAFDPQGIFNPGKKVRGNLSFAMSHIKPKP